MQSIFSGIDLVEINRFIELNPAVRERFFKRVFTQDELIYINDSNQRAAGIFAAKEAITKALGCGIGPIHWVDIEITHSVEKQPLVRLHARAKEKSDSLCITSWSVSITHSKKTAAAVAVATAEKF